MPESLPIYPVAPKLAVEMGQPRAFDPDCSRCPLRAGAKQVIRGEASGGEGPTLLVVGEGPGRDENEEGRPFVGRSGAKLRPLLRRLWKGNIVLENATRCYPGRGGNKVEVTEKYIDECRPFLSASVQEAQPSRVVTLGANAIYSLVGRAVSPLNSRRGYTWLWNNGNPVPVFYVLHPAAGLRNRFLMKFFEEDMEWALTARVPPPTHLSADFFANVVATPEDAALAVEELSKGEGFAFDLEYAGYMWSNDFRVLSFSASRVGTPSTWVWDDDALEDPARWEPLATLLKNPDVPKGGSNVKADLHALWCGKHIRVQGIAFDTRLQRKLLEPDATANLEDMAELVGMGGHKAEAEAAMAAIEKRIRDLAKGRAATRKSGQKGFDFAEAVDSAVRLGFDMEKYVQEPRAIAYAFLDPQLRKRYVARDALTTARLASRFTLQIARSPERSRIWEKVVLPAATAIQRVEEWGVPFDVQAGSLFNMLMQRGMDAAHVKVQQYRLNPDVELNPGSPQQLAQVLYDKLKMKVPLETDSGQPSTSEETLQLLKEQTGHPLLSDILEYRHYQKQVGYANDWMLRVREDGRIHPSIHLDGARSGRTSMSDPNLQNVSRAADSADGKAARDCFVAPRGKVLLQLDYSQLELRIASLLSGDKVMADLFRSGVDFHLGTAQLISKIAWGIEPDQVQKPHRTAAKSVNFALAYGKSVATLSHELGVTIEQGERIVNSILGRFTAFKKWSHEAISYAKQHGGCWTYWEGERARWRSLWRIADDSEDGAKAASRARNGAINTPIQGTASDFCVASIVRLVNMVDRGELDAEVVLPIHDSIMLVCPEKTWKDSALAAKNAMESYPWATDHVPLVVDVEVGTKWGSLEEAEL